jgi:hypothetical protein
VAPIYETREKEWFIQDQREQITFTLGRPEWLGSQRRIPQEYWLRRAAPWIGITSMHQRRVAALPNEAMM